MSDSLKVEFEGAVANVLAGRLHLPPGRPRAWALFAHCFTCSKDLKAAVAVSRGLAAEGIATLRFDFTGLGESEGDFADSNFSSNVDDLVAAADMLRERYMAPTILVGHSLGGAAALAAAHRIPEVGAVATIGAPCDPGHVRENFRGKLEQIESEGEADVELGGRTFRIKRQFLDDLEDRNFQEKIHTLGRALLIFHSPEDEVVGIENARRIYEAALHPKSFVSLEGADHLLSRRVDARYVSTVLAAWSSRYLPDVEDETGANDDWVSVANASGGLACEVRAGLHRWVADEPATVAGGADAGPDPYALLLGSLGTCTAMTLRMYARHKELALEDISVRLRHDRIHAKDCEDCETKEGKIDEITREITVTGDLTKDQRQRLMEIADKCPVHRTLTSETKIRTREIDES